MNNNSNILIYQNENGNIKVDVMFEDGSVWLSQAQICEVFGKVKSTISEHIKAIFEEGKLDEKVVVRNYRTTTKYGAIEGKTQTNDVAFYKLDMIIAIGFKVRSSTGTKFRIWANDKLKEYITKGFVLNDERFKNGTSVSYFDELQKRLRDIRISEKFFYQKVKDIYKTSIDYNPKDEKTIEFFKIVQNKLLWAVSSQKITMYMKDWIVRLDAIISLNGRELLKNAWKISHELAKAKSELEFEKFKEEHKKSNKYKV